MSPKITTKIHNDAFGNELKRLRLRSGIYTLQSLSNELQLISGIQVDPSLLSHWQRGARIPKDRQILLFLLKIFVNKQAITAISEGHNFCNIAGMGHLNESEIFEIFANANHQDTFHQTNIEDTKKPKMYFTAAIAQKDEFKKQYKTIVNSFVKANYEIFEDTTKVSLEEAINKSDAQRTEYYKTVVGWIDTCDVLVCEISFPSTLHIGHELTLALHKNKLVMAFYQQGREPSFFLGLKDKKLIWIEYTDENLVEIATKSAYFAKTLL